MCGPLAFLAPCRLVSAGISGCDSGRHRAEGSGQKGFSTKRQAGWTKTVSAEAACSSSQRSAVPRSRGLDPHRRRWVRGNVPKWSDTASRSDPPSAGRHLRAAGHSCPRRGHARLTRSTHPHPISTSLSNLRGSSSPCPCPLVPAPGVPCGADSAPLRSRKLSIQRLT